MTTVHEIDRYLEEFAPARLAEEWDNVGHLVGDAGRDVRRLMTCLTITPATVDEAVAGRADLVVSHHPFPFRPLKRMTTETTTGRLLLRLIESGIAVHSPHTAFDSAALGINQQLAEGLGLRQIQPLIPLEGDPQQLGGGRWGQLTAPCTAVALAEQLKAFLQVDNVHLVGPPAREMNAVAVACGSAGSFLQPARRAGCQVLVTGETNFHTCLEAEAEGVNLILPGHFASERFAVEWLAEVLKERFPHLTIWAARRERDPVAWL